MAMNHRFFNILIILLLLPCHARAGDVPPIRFKGIYECTLGGIALGEMEIALAQTPDRYHIESDIRTSGLLNLFVKHKSHAAVDAGGQNFSYPDVSYETNYSTRDKKHYVKLVYRNGVMTEDTQIPPENHLKRPEVPLAMKKDAVDPLSFLLKMRQGLWNSLSHREKVPKATDEGAFSVKIYDGNRLTEADFTIEGKQILPYGDKKLPVIKLGLRRKLLAGFTKSELAEYDPKEATLYVYVTDDERLLPVKIETIFMLNMLSARLVRECAVGESCLPGLRNN